MGYTTQFQGTLLFKTEPTASQLAALNQMLGEDARDHPEWGEPEDYITYIDLELTDDFTGIKWSGAEKTYGMVDAVNLILNHMRKTWPDFGLVGTLGAQGEEFNDRWALHIGEDGKAHKVDVAITGKVVKCPNCEHKFVLEGT